MRTGDAKTRSGIGLRQVAPARLWWGAPVAALSATAANSAVYLVADATGALSDEVVVPTAAGERPLGIGEVLFGTIVPIIAAAVVLAVVARFASRPLRTFSRIAVVVLVVSLGAPFSIAGAPVVAVATLMLMHVVAAAVGLPVLTRLARPTRAEPAGMTDSTSGGVAA